MYAPYSSFEKLFFQKENGRVDEDKDSNHVACLIRYNECDLSEEVAKLVKQTPRGRVIWIDLVYNHLRMSTITTRPLLASPAPALIITSPLAFATARFYRSKSNNTKATEHEPP